ncbi:uncharacterized protein LOC144508729 [Mustelus asterias]
MVPNVTCFPLNTSPSLHVTPVMTQRIGSQGLSGGLVPQWVTAPPLGWGSSPTAAVGDHGRCAHNAAKQVDYLSANPSDVPDSRCVCGTLHFLQRVQVATRQQHVTLGWAGCLTHQTSLRHLGRKSPLESGSTTGAIVGGIIAAIVILTVLVTAVLIFKRQRKNANEDVDDFEPPSYKPPPPKKNLEEIAKVEKADVDKMENIPLNTNYYETGTEDDNRMTLTQYYDEPDVNMDLKSPNETLPGVYLEQENPIYNELSYPEPEHRKSQEFVSKGMYV